jgi:DNA-binding protein H-NS
MEQNLTPVYCATELKAAEKKLEELKARRLELLRKKEAERDDAEKAELADYEELKANKAKWFELLQKAQGIVQVG